MRTAIDLFSGLGGFCVAAHTHGIKTVCFVEIDKRCREFLARAWPGTDQWDDIKTFPAERYRGVDFVFGGPPCTPVSCAGKQRGKQDDRWLWDEVLRVVEIIRPRWALFENPPPIRCEGGFCSSWGCREVKWLMVQLAAVTKERDDLKKYATMTDGAIRDLQARLEAYADHMADHAIDADGHLLTYADGYRDGQNAILREKDK